MSNFWNGFEKRGSGVSDLSPQELRHFPGFYRYVKEKAKEEPSSAGKRALTGAGIGGTLGALLLGSVGGAKAGLFGGAVGALTGAGTGAFSSAIHNRELDTAKRIPSTIGYSAHTHKDRKALKNLLDGFLEKGEITSQEHKEWNKELLGNMSAWRKDFNKSAANIGKFSRGGKTTPIPGMRQHPASPSVIPGQGAVSVSKNLNIKSITQHSKGMPEAGS